MPSQRNHKSNYYKKTIWLGIFSMQWLFIFFINISWSYFCPYCSICGNIQILHSIAEYCYFLWFNQTFMVETFRADSIFRHTYDEWVKSPPSHWMTLIYLLSFTSSIHWSSDHSLPRQGFDFSSEEMSENNHFHRQLTLLAPFPFRIGCVLTPTDPVYYPLPNVSYPPAVSPDPQSYNHHRVVCPRLSCPISNCQASKN